MRGVGNGAPKPSVADQVDTLAWEQDRGREVIHTLDVDTTVR